MEKLENKYLKEFDSLLELDSCGDERHSHTSSCGNNEEAHILQDSLYRKFINDIAGNKFKTLNEVKHFAKLMKNNVVKYDKGRWYS